MTLSYWRRVTELYISRNALRLAVIECGEVKAFISSQWREGDRKALHQRKPNLKMNNVNWISRGQTTLCYTVQSISNANLYTLLAVALIGKKVEVPGKPGYTHSCWKQMVTLSAVISGMILQIKEKLLCHLLWAERGATSFGTED